jgi:hypothetical protein
MGHRALLKARLLYGIAQVSGGHKAMSSTLAD